MGKNSQISPEDAVKFLESMRTLSADVDEKKKIMSIRIPEICLRLSKLKLKLRIRNIKTSLFKAFESI